MARPEKVAVVDEIRSKLTESDAAILTEYRGLTVGELAALRASLRPASTEYKVFKNTLARRAATGAGLDELAPLFEGPTAIAFVRGDAVVAAKALRDFGRGAPALVVKGGLLGGRVLSPADIEALADIEPREVLLARLAGGFQAPLTKAASLFQAFTRNFAYGLKAYLDQRAAEAPTEPVTDTGGEPAPATGAVDAPEPAPESAERVPEPAPGTGSPETESD